MPARTPSEPAAGVESLFERTAWGVVRFLGQAIATTGLVLLAPRRVPRLARVGDPRLAPPLSYLTATVFIAGVAARLHSTIDAQTRVGTEAIVRDLRETLLKANLAEAAALTFPSVLIVVAIAAGLVLATGGRRWNRRNPLFATCCYAAGLVYLAATASFAWIITNRLAGWFELSELPQYVGLGGMLFATGIAAWMISQALLGQTPRRKTTPGWLRYRVLRYPLAVGACVVFVVAGSVAMTASFDTDGAKQRARAEDYAQYFGGLNTDLIAWRFYANPDGGPDHVEVTVSLTNVEAAPFAVPRPDWLIPHEEPSNTSGDDPIAAVVLSCSIDRAAETALLIPPGETRLLRLLVRPAAACSRQRLGGVERLRYDLPVAQADELGFFHDEVAEIMLPTPHESASPHVATRPQAANGDSTR